MAWLWLWLWAAGWAPLTVATRDRGPPALLPLLETLRFRPPPLAPPLFFPPPPTGPLPASPV